MEVFSSPGNSQMRKDAIKPSVLFPEMVCPGSPSPRGRRPAVSCVPLPHPAPAGSEGTPREGGASRAKSLRQTVFPEHGAWPVLPGWEFGDPDLQLAARPCQDPRVLKEAGRAASLRPQPRTLVWRSFRGEVRTALNPLFLSPLPLPSSSFGSEIAPTVL